MGRGFPEVDSGVADGVNSSPDTEELASRPRTQEGAVAAADDIARTMTGPSGDEDLYRQRMDSIAADQWRDRAAELAENSIAFVHDRYGAGGGITFNPIRFRLVSYSEERATVELWGVVLGYGPNVVGFEESWITGTIQLTWIEDQWKSLGQSSKGGPTPESLRTEDDIRARSVLEDFEELDSGT